MKKFDVVVVGGSVAGSTAAYLLGRSGRSVALIEPAEFPRYKACGEGLSSLGISLLDQAGLWSRVLEGNSLPFYGYELHLKGGGSLKLAPNQKEKIEGRGVQRSLLDNELFNAAKSVASHFSCRARGFKRRSSTWEINTDSCSLSAREVVLAWGATPKFRRDESIESSYRGRDRYGFVIWFEGRWKNQRDGLIHAYQSERAQFLTTPVSDSVLNVSILIDKKSDRSWSKGELLDHAMQIAEERDFDVERILKTAGSAEIHSSPIANFVPGAYCIGDALERFDPIGGMGMTHAISSATWISQVLNRKFKRNTEWDIANREYLRCYRRQSWYYRNLTRLNFMAAAAISPNLTRALARFPRMSAKIMNLGKDLSRRNCMELVGGS